MLLYFSYQASKRGHDKNVRILISNQECNINLIDEKYRTALQIGEYFNI
jgi:hypothetical protein